MEGIKIFERQEFGQVRVVDVNGEPWFVASDIAKALGYERPNDAVNTHCKKVNKFSYGDMPQGAQPYNIIPGECKGRNPIPTPGGEQEMLIKYV